MDSLPLYCMILFLLFFFILYVYHKYVFLCLLNQETHLEYKIVISKKNCFEKKTKEQKKVYLGIKYRYT